MQRLPNVHPSDLTKWPNKLGTFDVGAADSNAKILFYNLTPLNLDLDFLNGSTDVLHAWEANWWILDGDTKQIEWLIDADSLSVTVPPVDAVFMTLYGPGEKIPGTYPVSIMYQASIGNTVSTVATGSALSNEGNAANTLVIDIGDVANSLLWQIFTDHFLIEVDQGGTPHQVLKGQTAGNPLQIGQAGDTTEVLGILKASAYWVLTNLIKAAAANDLTLDVPTGQSVFFQINNASVASIDASGFNANNGVNFNIGRIKDINEGNFSASGTINHGLSGTPRNVLLCPSVSGSTWTFQASNFTTTQFTATLFSALNTNFTAYR